MAPKYNRKQEAIMKQENADAKLILAYRNDVEGNVRNTE